MVIEQEIAEDVQQGIGDILLRVRCKGVSDRDSVTGPQPWNEKKWPPKIYKFGARSATPAQEKFEGEGEQGLSKGVRNGDTAAHTADTLIRPNEGNGEWRVWWAIPGTAASMAELLVRNEEHSRP